MAFPFWPRGSTVFRLLVPAMRCGGASHTRTLRLGCNDVSNLPQFTNSNADIDGFALGSLLYLTLPTLIFFVGFFRPAIGIMLAALTIIGLVYVFKLRTGGWHITSPGRLAIVIGVALIWASLGGAGHFFYANSDWIVRDVVLRDLVVSDWPPTYGKMG